MVVSCDRMKWIREFSREKLLVLMLHTEVIPLNWSNNHYSLFHHTKPDHNLNPIPVFTPITTPSPTALILLLGNKYTPHRKRLRKRLRVEYAKLFTWKVLTDKSLSVETRLNWWDKWLRLDFLTKMASQEALGHCHAIKYNNRSHSTTQVKNLGYDTWLTYKQPGWDWGLCGYSLACYKEVYPNL